MLAWLPRKKAVNACMSATVPCVTGKSITTGMSHQNSAACSLDGNWSGSTTTRSVSSSSSLPSRCLTKRSATRRINGDVSFMLYASMPTRPSRLWPPSCASLSSCTAASLLPEFACSHCSSVKKSTGGARRSMSTRTTSSVTSCNALAR